jgi:thiosulfate/3-mercaptopyruvate sulfurtransferase
VVLYDEGLTSRLCRTAFFLGLGGLEVRFWTEGWEELATEKETPKPEPSDTLAHLQRDWLLTADEAARHPLLLDVRSPEEHKGLVHPLAAPGAGGFPAAGTPPGALF